MKIPSSTLLDQLNWRYAVKKFDQSKKIDAETWQVLEKALILSPSSYGLQPWRFVVITDPTIKSQLPAISWNQNQPADCSHMVVLAAKEQIDNVYLDNFIAFSESTRGLASGTLSGFRKMLSAVEKMESQWVWNSNQVYIALGQLMVAAALLEIDSCPMEGIVPDAYDRLLGLTESGYRTVVACAMGYRDASDPYASSAKVRFSADQLVKRI
jgi:nitroreductase